jgi:hypothetical protein
MQYRHIDTGDSSEGRSCVIADGFSAASGTPGLVDFWKTTEAPPFGLGYRMLQRRCFFPNLSQF